MKNKTSNFQPKPFNKPSTIGVIIILLLQKVFKESSVLLALLFTESYKVYKTAKEKMEKAAVKTYK